MPRTFSEPEFYARFPHLAQVIEDMHYWETCIVPDVTEYDWDALPYRPELLEEACARLDPLERLEVADEGHTSGRWLVKPREGVSTAPAEDAPADTGHQHVDAEPFIRRYAPNLLDSADLRTAEGAAYREMIQQRHLKYLMDFFDHVADIFTETTT